MPVYQIVGYFLYMAAAWGASFMFMRIGVPEFGAFSFAGLRLLMAGLILSPMLFLVARRRQEFKANWLRLSAIALLNLAIPFTLFAIAAHSINASTASVLNATTPMLTGIIAHLIFKDYLTRWQFLGLFIGVVGVALLMLDSAKQHPSHLNAAFLILIACLLYAISGNLTKRYLAHIGPMTTAASGLLVSGIAMLPLTFYHFPAQTISLSAWGAVFGIAVLSTALAMLAYYSVIKIVGPTRTSSVTLLVPVFGIFWGMVLLNEQVTLKMLIGTVIIIAGTSLTQFMRRAK
ncbi:DMT family transporter [Ostreibacterium oceani]|uniref:EamA family transporter n=1 Tax=Ostreibacterium oceani TaxID=2654998 RepID=A0A6N7EZH3_9GAMM|nr:DMT family transporter [Ostreibacterium oceani]MPV86960.1 EamA family transporter [Ostreibacterium oceani]